MFLNFTIDVTLGVPRIKEIINAAKRISTPIITAVLEYDDNVILAKMVKGRVEKTLLGQVNSHLHDLISMQIQVEMFCYCYGNLGLKINVPSSIFLALLETISLIFFTQLSLWFVDCQEYKGGSRIIEGEDSYNT